MRRKRHRNHAHHTDDPRYRDPGTAPVFERPADAPTDAAPRADDPATAATDDDPVTHHETRRTQTRRRRHPADPPPASLQ